MPKDVEQAFDREAALLNEELAAGNETFKKAVFANHVGGSASEPLGADTAWRGACAPFHAGAHHEKS